MSMSKAIHPNRKSASSRRGIFAGARALAISCSPPARDPGIRRPARWLAVPSRSRPFARSRTLRRSWRRAGPAWRMWSRPPSTSVIWVISRLSTRSTPVTSRTQNQSGPRWAASCWVSWSRSTPSPTWGNDLGQEDIAWQAAPPNRAFGRDQLGALHVGFARHERFPGRG